jgi:glutamate--cysteine ligase
LLELITPPFSEIDETLEFLSQTHQFIYGKLDDELLWATSMPCLLEGESSIPIAYYGTSNVGKMKHVYRRGLECLYGRTMQAIAGVHFNYSLPEHFWPVFQEMENNSKELKDFISDCYFGLIRNFQRQGWLIPYLFGASPAVCRSFFNEPPSGFDEFGAGTYYQPYATSLRMSDIGYKNKAQADLGISYNNLEEYVRSLTQAIETPDPEYARVGVVVNGDYRQLNANILQIENEYYSFVRPKQVMKSGEKPTLALKHRGVQYVEIRALDVDLCHPLGVTEPQLRFLEAFLIYCLLQESPPMSPDEQKEVERNQQMVACCGRDPSLKLYRLGSRQPLRQWAAEICDMMQSVAELLDAGDSERLYSKALAEQKAVINYIEQTPSAILLDEMHKGEESFFHFALDMSERHEKYFKEANMPVERMVYFDNVAKESVRRQQEIETADEISFEQYLEAYFSQS